MKNTGARKSPKFSSPSDATFPAASDPEALGVSLARAAEALQVLNVRFIGFSAKTSHRFGEKIADKVHVRVGFTTPAFVLVAKAVVVTTTFVFRLLAEDEEAVFQYRAETEIAYAVTRPTPPSVADLGVFSRLNAPFNAWPYWREALQSALSRMDLPAFPLPLLHSSDLMGMTLPDGHPDFDDT